MAVKAGVKIVLEYYDGANWIEVGKQVTGDLQIDNNTADITTKDNNGWSSFLATVSSWSMSVEGKMDRGDAGVLALENAALNRTEITVRWREKDGSQVTFSGTAALQNFGYSFPVDDAASWSVSLQGNGALTRGSAV